MPDKKIILIAEAGLMGTTWARKFIARRPYETQVWN